MTLKGVEDWIFWLFALFFVVLFAQMAWAALGVILHGIA